MSDDRFSTKIESPYDHINFREYVGRVISDQSRHEELKILMLAYSMEHIDSILNGGENVSPIEFAKNLAAGRKVK